MIHAELVAGKRDPDREDAGASRICEIVSPYILGQDFRRKLHGRVIGGFSNQVRAVLLILRADVFEHLCVDDGLHGGGSMHGPRVDCGILKSHVQIDVSEIGAMEALRHTQSFAVRVAANVERGAVIVAVALHHQRVALPVPHRVAHPAWVGVLLQAAAVHEYLAEREVRIENRDQAGGLYDLEPFGISDETVGGSRWQARHAVVVPAEIVLPLAAQRRSPWLDFLRLQVPRHVSQMRVWIDPPHARKIRLAVRHPRGRLRWGFRLPGCQRCYRQNQYSYASHAPML